MKKILLNGWFLLGLRFAIAGVFVYAGWIKWMDPISFADSIATFRLLPEDWISLVALSLPPLEIILGLCLLTGIRKEGAVFGIVILCLVFALALGQAFIRGIVVDCGCLGSGPPTVAGMWWSLGRDFILILAAAWLYTAWHVIGLEKKCCESQG